MFAGSPFEKFGEIRGKTHPVFTLQFIVDGESISIDINGVSLISGNRERSIRDYLSKADFKLSSVAIDLKSEEETLPIYGFNRSVRSLLKKQME